MMEDRIKRIQEMEAVLDDVSAAVRGLEEALDGYAAVQERFRALVRYYESPEWMRDYEDDEAGRFPKDLKRGVLSQDAVYDLIAEAERIQERMKELTE